MHTPRPQGQLRTDPPPSRPARISAVEPADLVSYIQHTLGFVPRNSIAAITLADRCLGAVLRCDWDLSLGRDPTATTAYARQVAGYLSADERADGSLVVLFRDAAGHHSGQDATDRVVAEALAAELSAAGLPVREAWLVAGGRLWHLDCPDRAACAAHGSAVAGLETSAVNTAFIVEGSVVRDEPPADDLPEPAPVMGRDLQDAVDRLRADGLSGTGVADWLADWDRVLAGAPLPNESGARARLLAGLVDVRLRDTLVAAASFTLLRAVSGAVWLGVLPRAVTGRLGAPVREADAVLYSSVVLAASHRAPDWGRIARLRQACALLLPEAAGESAAAARCLVAWVEWARGRGSLAGRIMEQCRAACPDYPLAILLGEVIDRGILAGWARRRSTAWSSARGRR